MKRSACKLSVITIRKSSILIYKRFLFSIFDEALLRNDSRNNAINLGFCTLIDWERFRKESNHTFYRAQKALAIAFQTRYARFVVFNNRLSVTFLRLVQIFAVNLHAYFFVQALRNLLQTSARRPRLRYYRRQTAFDETLLAPNWPSR